MNKRARILCAVVSVACILPSTPLTALAQHGGGHSGGGGHFSGGGFSSHGSFGGGHISAGHASGGYHAGSAVAPRSYSRGFSRATRTSRGFSRGYRRGTNIRIRTYGFGNNCYGYRCGYGWGYGYPWLYGGIDPYWWWDSGSSHDQEQQDQIGLANEMNAQSLDEQRMREQSDQNFYPRSPSAEHPAERTEAAPATVLVFLDQHKEEIQNYAIVGQTLWIFAPQRTQKVPLADLDLDGTHKANDERGVDFRLPGAREGQ